MLMIILDSTVVAQIFMGDNKSFQENGLPLKQQRDERTEDDPFAPQSPSLKGSVQNSFSQLASRKIANISKNLSSLCISIRGSSSLSTTEGERISEDGILQILNSIESLVQEVIQTENTGHFRETEGDLRPTIHQRPSLTEAIKIIVPSTRPFLFIRRISRAYMRLYSVFWPLFPFFGYIRRDKL